MENRMRYKRAVVFYPEFMFHFRLCIMCMYLSIVFVSKWRTDLDLSFHFLKCLLIFFLFVFDFYIQHVQLKCIETMQTLQFLQLVPEEMDKFIDCAPL